MFTCWFSTYNAMNNCLLSVVCCPFEVFKVLYKHKAEELGAQLKRIVDIRASPVRRFSVERPVLVLLSGVSRRRVTRPQLS